VDLAQRRGRLMYHSISAYDPVASTVEMLSLQPILQPKPPSVTDTMSGTVMATLMAVLPAVAAGALMGATAAGYDEKQRAWAWYGAAAGGAVAALLMALNAARKG